MSNAATAAKPADSMVRHDRPKALLAKQLCPPEHRYGRMHVTLPVGWTIEDALKPEFWANVANQFRKVEMTNDPDRIGTIIELRTIDHAFYAEVYVRAVQERGLVVQLLGEPVYFGPKAVESTAFEVRWNVARRGYDIIRKSDREIVGEAAKFPTREAAQDWIEKTLKVN